MLMTCIAVAPLLVVRELGFDCYVNLNLQPVRTYAATNYLTEWQARYLAHSHTHADPVAAMARASR